MVIFLSETRSSLCIDTTLLQLQLLLNYFCGGNLQRRTLYPAFKVTVTEMGAQQDKETSGDHLAKMTSMSGFKFAVSFLFNSATEAMATATRRAREVTVLSIL